MAFALFWIPETWTRFSVDPTTTHFSNYVIAYDAECATACPKDVTCPISAFMDADATAWYHDGVHWALENGVMTGVSKRHFNPNGAVTREQLATMLMRYAAVK